MHSRLRIANSHESAATEFFHELSYHTLNLIHIDGRLLVFAEHRAGRFVGLVDALRHDLHGIADLLHVLHHVAVGSFHFLHSAVNYPDILSQLFGIIGNACDTLLHLRELLSCHADHLKRLGDGFRHLPRLSPPQSKRSVPEGSSGT